MNAVPVVGVGLRDDGQIHASHFRYVTWEVRDGQQSLSQAHVIEITPERRLAARRSNELGHVPNSAGEDARRSISTISKRLRF